MAYRTTEGGTVWRDDPDAYRETVSCQEPVEVLAAAVVSRVLSVYREEYIQRCVEQEPDSLLALVKRLEAALNRV